MSDNKSPISRDPEIQGGDLVFDGTRVPISALESIPRAGGTIDEFLEGYPTVERWQVEAVLDAPGAILSLDGFYRWMLSQMQTPEHREGVDRLSDPFPGEPDREAVDFAQIALARKEAIERGEMGTTSLEDMIAEFAPELMPRENEGSDDRPFLSERLYDDPVVVIDTTWSYKLKCWGTIVYGREPRIQDVEAIRSDTWKEAEAAHERVRQKVRLRVEGS